jgi:hypothetical protein
VEICEGGADDADGVFELEELVIVGRAGGVERLRLGFGFGRFGLASARLRWWSLVSLAMERWGSVDEPGPLESAWLNRFEKRTNYWRTNELQEAAH